MVGMAKLGSDCQRKQGFQTQKMLRKLSPAKFLFNLTNWILSLCHKRGILEPRTTWLEPITMYDLPGCEVSDIAARLSSPQY